MANRSYLYSISNQPNNHNDRPDIAYGLSEWAYSIPLIHRILMSGDPKRCESLIFSGLENDDFDEDEDECEIDEEQDLPLYAVTSHFESGYKRLKKFLSILEVLFSDIESDIIDNIQETICFLEKNKLPYLILDTVEIDMMLISGADNLRDAVDEEIERCLSIGKVIDELPDNIDEAAKIVKSAIIKPKANELYVFSDIRLDETYDHIRCGEPLGLSYWSNDLYYYLLNKKEFEENK